MNLNDLTIADLKMLSDLPGCKSLRLWAKQERCTPARAGRLLARLEENLGLSLMVRSNRGLVPTPVAEQLAKRAYQVLNAVEHLRTEISGEEVVPFERSIVFGARGFLGIAMARQLVAVAQTAGVGLQIIDLSPLDTATAVREECLGIVLGLEDIDYGRNWQRRKVGHLHWRIYARSGHPLELGASKADIIKFRLGHHIYWDGRRLVSNEGTFHDKLGVGQLGFGTQTTAAAIAVAIASDQLIVIPELAARDYVSSGRLIEIPAAPEFTQSVPVFLHGHQDRISKKIWTTLVQEFTRALK